MSSIIKRHRTANESPGKTSLSLSSSPATAVDGNEDLLMEILRRLPAKSLLRFRSVSKRWLFLISSPNFTVLWTTPKSKSLSGLFLRRLSNSGIPKLEYIPLLDHHGHHQRFTSLDFVDDQPEGVDILQSCNGLLLCSSFRLRHHSCNYCVYNPTTMKFTALPRPFGYENRIVRGVSLAFDSSKSAHYKVICVFSHSSLLRGIYWVQIYSSETRRWEPYDDLVLGPFDVVFDKGVFCNSLIHWLSRVSDTSLCFDVDEQCHKTIPMPPLGKGEKERTCGYFGESRGHLHLVLSSGSGTALLDVFEMARDYSKWSVKCRVDLEFVLTPFLEMQVDFSVPLDYCKFSLLCLLCGEVEDELAMVIYVAGKAIRYNLKDKSIEKLYDVKKQNKDDYIAPNCRWVIGHPYFESLISV